MPFHATDFHAFGALYIIIDDFLQEKDYYARKIVRLFAF